VPHLPKKKRGRKGDPPSVAGPKKAWVHQSPLQKKKNPIFTKEPHKRRSPPEVTVDRRLFRLRKGNEPNNIHVRVR